MILTILKKLSIFNKVGIFECQIIYYEYGFNLIK